PRCGRATSARTSPTRACTSTGASELLLLAARVGRLDRGQLLVGQPEALGADHEPAHEVVGRGESLVAGLTGAEGVRDLALPVGSDLRLALRVDFQLDDPPVVALRIESAPALDHGLERQDLQDGVHGVARWRERSRLGYLDGLPQPGAAAIEDVEVRALDLLALQQTAEVPGPRVRLGGCRGPRPEAGGQDETEP